MKRTLVALVVPVVMMVSLVVSVPRSFAASGASPGSTTLSGTASFDADPGFFLNGGVETVVNTTNAGVSGFPNDLKVNVTPPAPENSWTLEFGAPEGQTLTAGTVYDDALGVPAGSTPLLSATYGSQECTGDGRFDVIDLADGPGGMPDRLWIIYELHCGGEPALFGEIRLGEPAASGALQSAPTVVRWPADDFGVTETPVPVLYRATQSTTIASVALAGDDSDDYRISQDNCTGLTLGTGDTCTVWVDLDPAAPGTVDASLAVTTSAGQTVSTPLQGFTFGGASRLTLVSDPGDDLLNGQNVSVGVAGNDFNGWGTPTQISMYADTGTHTYQAEFEPPKGQTLTTGSSWSGVTQAPFNTSTAAAAEITVDSGACAPTTGTFTVVGATYDGHDQLTSADIDFSLRCSGATGDVHGELQWRAGDPVAPAPWMDPDATGAPASGAAPSDPGSGSGSAPATPVAPAGGGATTGPAGTGGGGSSGTTGTVTPPSVGGTPTARGTPPPISPAVLRQLYSSLSRAGRDVRSTTTHLDDHGASTRARRAVGALARELSIVAHRLRSSDGRSADATREALAGLARWSRSLTAVRRLLASSASGSSAALVRAVDREARAGTAALAALRALAAG